jgi:hypothetical protein
MKDIMPYLPFLVPVAIIELALAITALIHVLRHKSYRFGNRIFWAIIVLVVQIIGPILYFTVGKGDD